MTQGSPGGLEPAEQERLTRQLGRALVTAAGEGWQQVWAQYRSAGKHVEADLVITGADGQQRAMRPPQAMIDLFGKLRGGMYRPDRGTWLSATYLIEPSGGYAVEYEPDAEPAWRRVPPPIGFQDELRWFPRAEDAVPEWLRVRAGIAPTPATGVPVGAPTPDPTPDGPAQPGGGQPPSAAEPGPAQGNPQRGGQPPRTGPTPAQGGPGNGPAAGGPTHGGPPNHPGQGGPGANGPRPAPAGPGPMPPGRHAQPGPPPGRPGPGQGQQPMPPRGPGMPPGPTHA